MTTKQPELVYSTNGESFQHSGLGEVFDELACDYSDPELVGQTYHVGEKVSYTPSQFFRGGADQLIESARDAAFDVADEWAGSFAASVPNAARDELDALIKAWADKHLTCNFYTVKNVREVAITQADLES